MKLCLKAGFDEEQLQGAAKAGFVEAEAGLLDLRRLLSCGGSLDSVLAAFKDAGLKAAVQIPLPMPMGFGGGMASGAIPDPEDLLSLAGLVCTRGGASVLIVDPFSIGKDSPLIPDDMMRDDVRLSLLRLIAEHPYLRPCLRPSAAEGCSVRTLKDAAAVLESLNRHEAGLCCDLSLLGEEEDGCLKSLPRGMVKVLRLCSSAKRNLRALKALEGAPFIACATLGESAALDAEGGIA
ncbi:MAG: hypothetical protein ACI4NA_08260 [Succinivibrio sp.]